jgi:hypothetical protein
MPERAGCLPERFLTVSAQDIGLEGWEQLDERLGEADVLDFPEMPAASEIVPTGPTGRLASDDEASEAGEAAAPFELDQFMQPEEPTPEQWASTYDLPTASEYGAELATNLGITCHGPPPASPARK